ncbi:hypothetical protein [Solemya velesiana gill symbiont]|uniref:hypothetical protein n=1 Tax=Solemya velesiana gill symbiont TaxID=1918948 RepID=UPI00267E4D98
MSRDLPEHARYQSANESMTLGNRAYRHDQVERRQQHQAEEPQGIEQNTRCPRKVNTEPEQLDILPV